MTAPACSTDHRGPRSRLVGWVIFGALLAGTAAAQEPWQAARGDLGSGGTDLERLLGATHDPAEARAMFDRLHAMLVDQVGADRVSEAELLLGAMDGMLQVANRRMAADGSSHGAALPPAGALLNEAEVARDVAALSGRLTGAGVELQVAGQGVLLVSRVLPGSPASVTALRPGDAILGINGRPVAGGSLPALAAELRGDAGSKLVLDVQRGGGLAASRFRVLLERQPFPVVSIEAALQPDGYAYLRVHQFHAGTAAELRDAIAAASLQGASGLVVDLRGTPGGDLDAAMGCAGLLLPPGTPMLRAVDPLAGEEDLVAAGGPVTELPAVLLVDGWTFGAAEAFAAALQALGRAELVGEPTLGRARAQRFTALGAGLILRLDALRLETPTGGTWQGTGLLPDRLVWRTQTPGVGGSGLDPQYESAVHTLEVGGAAPAPLP